MRLTRRQLRQIIKESLHENLWDNIRKKRARGEKPAKKGEKGYPDEKSWKSATKESDEKDLDEADELDEVDCWDGYSPGAQTGVKTKKGKGGKRVNNCEKIKEADEINEAEYDGRKVKVNKPTAIRKGDTGYGDKQKKVYVKDGPKEDDVKVVRFGDPDSEIRRDNPEAKKSFRARHNCDSPGPKTKARYWSCKEW